MGEQNKLTIEGIIDKVIRQVSDYQQNNAGAPKCLSEISDARIEDINHFLQQETAALREELKEEREKHGLTMLSWRQDNDSRCAKINDLEKELEAVKKERDTFGQNVEMFRQEVKKRTDFADWVTRQRDELQAALDEIANPIRYMKSRLKDGEQIDGAHAALLSNNANYLKDIAEKSLSRLSSGETKRGGYCTGKCIWESTEDGAICKKCGAETPF